MELGTQEWQDALFLQYDLDPPDLPHYCDGCKTNLSICHALDYKQGGLVTARQNELRDEVADLAGIYFTPTHVHNNPLIFAGCAVKRSKAKPARSKATKSTSSMLLLEAAEQKGDLLIRDLWQNGTGSVHDMCVVNTDAKFHLAKTLEKYLKEEDRAKKKMYLGACLQQRQNFSPFIDSVDGILGVGTTANLKMIASCLKTKLRQTSSRTYGYVKSRITITLVRSTQRCIRGYRVLAQRISFQRPQC